MKRGLVVLGLLLTAACGGGGGGDGAREDDAMAVAERIEAKVDSVTELVEITEDNDPNESIGRPGQYDEGVSISDERAECDSDLDVTCGAKLERWPNKAAAEERSEFIQSLLDEGSGLLGSEYHYIEGGMLLRVTGQIKPSEAEEYEAALSG